MSGEPTRRACHHGALARQCELCQAENEIADLRAKLAAAEKERDDLHRAHCRDLDEILALGLHAHETEKERDWARAEVEHIRESLVRVWRDRAKRAEQGLSLARAWLAADVAHDAVWSEHEDAECEEVCDSYDRWVSALRPFAAWCHAHPESARKENP